MWKSCGGDTLPARGALSKRGWGLPRPRASPRARRPGARPGAAARTGALARRVGTWRVGTKKAPLARGALHVHALPIRR
jgi:hypothetical protein